MARRRVDGDGISRRRVLGALGLGAAGAVAAGGRSSSWFEALVPAAGAAAATALVTIDPSVVVGAVPERMLGFSMERARLFQPLLSADNGPIRTLLTLLGPGVLRLGGSSVEEAPWAPAGPGLTTGVVAPADVARLAELVDAVDWTVLYGTPFVLGTAATVADEVHTVAARLGKRLMAVELANEPDLYPVEPFAAAVAGFDKFHARWQEFADAIAGTTPEVVFAGPANALLQTYPGWFKKFADLEHARAPVLTQHYYRGAGSSGSIGQLLTPDALLRETLAKIEQTATTYGVAHRLGETNSYANGGTPGVSNTLASALWLQDLYFTAAEFGAAGVNVHNSGAGAGYPAIAQLNGVVTEVRPLFYGMLLAARAGHGDLVSTVVSSDAPSVRAYSVLRGADSLAVVLVNTASTEIVIGVEAGRAVRAATASHLVGPGGLDATTGVTFLGATVGIDGAWTPDPPTPQPHSGSSVEAVLPAASVTLLELAIDPPTTTTTTPTSTSAVSAPPAAAAVAATPTFTG